MKRIELEKAEDGVIKTVQDDNYNGKGHEYEEKKVYHLEGDPENSFEQTARLLDDIFADLNIDLHSKNGEQLSIVINKPSAPDKTNEE